MFSNLLSIFKKNWLQVQQRRYLYIKIILNTYCCRYIDKGTFTSRSLFTYIAVGIVTQVPIQQDHSYVSNYRFSEVSSKYLYIKIILYISYYRKSDVGTYTSRLFFIYLTIGSYSDIGTYKSRLFFTYLTIVKPIYYSFTKVFSHVELALKAFQAVSSLWVIKQLRPISFQTKGQVLKYFFKLNNPLAVRRTWNQEGAPGQPSGLHTRLQ